MLVEVKTALRISNTAFDSEIEELIASARLDLIMAGVSSQKAKAESDIDPLIERAIKTYCKANFGYNNPDADRFQDAYVMLKQHLSLSSEYAGDNNA